MGNRSASNSSRWLRPFAAFAPLAGCALVAHATTRGVFTREAIEDVTAPALALGIFVCLQTRRKNAGFAGPVSVALPFLWWGLLGLFHALAAIGAEHRLEARSASVVQLGLFGFATLMLLSVLPIRWPRGRGWRAAGLGGITAGALSFGAFGPTLFGVDTLRGWTGGAAGSVTATLLVMAAAQTLVRRKDPAEIRIASNAGLATGLVVAALDAFGTGWGLFRGERPAQAVFFEVALPLAPLLGLVLDDVVCLRRSAHARLRLSMIGMLGAMILMATMLASSLGDAVDPSQRLLVLGLLAPAFVVTLIVTVANRTIMSRLDDLVDVTRSFATGEMRVRAQIGPGDEITRLALAFNGLAERISYQAQELRLLAEVMKESGESMLVIDVQRRIAFCNRAFTQTTGWTRLDVVGRSYDGLLAHRLDQDQRDALWRATLVRGEWSRRTTIRRREGQTDEVEVHVLAVRKDDELIGFVAVHRDLALARDLEREREAYTEGLLRISTTAQILLDELDFDLVRTSTVRTLAQEFDAESRLWTMCVDDEGRPRLLAASSSDGGDRGGRVPPLVAAVARDRRPVVIDDRAAACDDPEASRVERGGAMGVFPLVLHDELFGVLEIGMPGPIAGRSRDTFMILARLVCGALRQAEIWRRAVQRADDMREIARMLERSKQRLEINAAELREANAKLTESARLKTMFLSTASHELRTPVSSVLGFLDLLIDGVEESEEERREFLREAHSCGQHLLAVVNDILDVARIEAGRIHLIPRDVELAEILDEVHALAGIGISREGLEVTFEADPDVAVWADPQRCRQALVNLVGNAMKFTLEGSVRVIARAVPERGLVEIRVVDTGVGLEPGDCERVFAAFVQAEGGDTRRFGGSGLGLAITRRLVGLMGGTLRLESEGLGRGCTAVCTLPLARGEVGEPPASDAVPEGQDAVLLVDGDPRWLRALAEALRAEDVPVLIAGTADAAWRHILDARPRLIVSDHALPCANDADKMTGLDLARAMFAEESLESCELILVSGHPLAAEPLASALAALGDLRRFEKPCDPLAIARLCRDALRDAVTT